MTPTNRQWILESRPVGDELAAALKLREQPVPEPGPGEVVVRTLYISLDPANRMWMSAGRTTCRPFPSARR